MKTTRDIRRAFLSYFEGHGHTILPSSSLVPENDPTLMFANAGMNQFKDIFTGQQKAPQPPRATTSQKCVRAGGKHNDLDNVGYTARHHTFFEMLGNFSFGDYFKEQAIVHAWELLTKDFGLAPEKLYCTVYHTDDEAFNLWKKVTGFSDDKILRVPTNDNFWAMGDTGPCGPCSEVFYDHGAEADDGQWKLDANGNDLFGDRFIEIWNLVFMQYEQKDADTRINLPKPSVDTGMGLERTAAVMQGVHNNYDIDLFKNLIVASESITSTKAEGAQAASHRVIADHLRSTCFLMADGVLPSNEGRGYVLRRIMRRAMRHVHLLGAKDTVMHKLVPALLSEMGDAFPELERAKALMTETLRHEEERFRETLGRGMKLLDEELGKLSGKSLSGDVAFKLYDTYGFPLDLTQDILRGKDLSVDTDGFDSCMKEQKDRARAAWKGSGDAGTTAIWHEIRDDVGASEFLGYASDKSSAQVLAMVKGGTRVQSCKAGDEVQIVLNQSPSYGESGGQIGDMGSLLKQGALVGSISDTTKPHADLLVHRVKAESEIIVGESVDVVVDSARRDAIRANHSATHLLHAALRNQLGEHITQKGSLVAEDRLRFDISHQKAVTPEELQAIEDEVNAIIWQNDAVTTRLMQPEEAIKAGAMALFGEKYGDEVRVLSMGKNADDTDYSVELCGGTHVTRTGDIGLMKIISESAIAAGVRRIEAITRDGAFAYLRDQESTVKGLAAELKITPEDVGERIGALLGERKALQKELADAKTKLALGGGGSGDAAPESIGNIQFIGKHFDEMPPKELRNIANGMVQKLGASGIVAITSGFEGKASVLVALTSDLTANMSAADYVQLAVPILGGKGGGGKPEMAQGGGSDPAKGEEALNAIRGALKQKIAA